ncbi:MAG TPA: hypothetical protein ENK14_08925 [Caldithrix sp.]|nr:hypothetical protein [Caldithrix sp.]
MAKVKFKKNQKPTRFHFPLIKTNFLILGLGVIILIVGYIFMAIPTDPDAFLTRTLSPILLVFAYLIVIPIGLFYREKKNN